jgi:predicted nuclease with TOPRIM domain
MIDIFYLKSAAEIRRKYLKVSSNVSLYRRKADEILAVLNNSLIELEKLQKEVSENNSKDSINKLLDIISNVEQEGSKLEIMIDPMNKEIEILSKEENELYRNIKEKYHMLTDSDIIKYVREYLISQGL